MCHSTASHKDGTDMPGTCSMPFRCPWAPVMLLCVHPSIWENEDNMMGQVWGSQHMFSFFLISLKVLGASRRHSSTGREIEQRLPHLRKDGAQYPIPTQGCGDKRQQYRAYMSGDWNTNLNPCLGEGSRRAHNPFLTWQEIKRHCIHAL